MISLAHIFSPSGHNPKVRWQARHPFQEAALRGFCLLMGPRLQRLHEAVRATTWSGWAVRVQRQEGWVEPEVGAGEPDPV